MDDILSKESVEFFVTDRLGGIVSRYRLINLRTYLTTKALTNEYNVTSDSHCDTLLLPVTVKSFVKTCVTQKLNQVNVWIS